MWKDRKKAQKEINKMTRAMNTNILRDNLWHGRFYVHQVDANWERFDDGSGGCLNVWLEIRDKKTGKYHGFQISNYSWDWEIWFVINDFICNDSGVWDDIDAVKSDKTDWTKVKFTPREEVY